MGHQCENCGQAALETDVICWSCGHALPRQVPILEAVPGPEKGEYSVPLTSLAAYGGITIVIVIALLFVMRSLGRQPQFVRGAESALQPGWTAVTDSNRLFTLNLPVPWDWLDRNDSLKEADFIAEVRQSSRYQVALAPFDGMTDDRRLLLLASENLSGEQSAEPVFVVIIRSEQLSRYSSEQVAAFLRTAPGGATLSRFDLAESRNGRPRGIYIISIPHNGQEMRCQNLFFNNISDSYLIIGCSDEKFYNDYANIIHEILVSFQPLLR